MHKSILALPIKIQNAPNKFRHYNLNYNTYLPQKVKIILNKKYVLTCYMLLALMIGCSISLLSATSINHSDRATNAQVQEYLKSLAAKGFPKQYQGVWIQADTQVLANHQGQIPMPAASLSKIAVTLVTLETLGAEHQFVTQIGTNGSIQNGVLKGDLIVEGSYDPFFVWEEAFKIGNLLNQLGIKRITGNLVIVGEFSMNFKDDPLTAGNLLKVGLNSSIWSDEAKKEYQSLPPGTAKPQVVIDGAVQMATSRRSSINKPLVRHYSYPLAELLKKMNLFSNNFMADKLATSVGGASKVESKAAAITGLPQSEIKLINGSGLSTENRISPRAVCAMFQAIEKYLQPHNMTVADVFNIAGVDKGILDKRAIPKFAVVKSGSFDNVSNLAGALPTQQRGIVWFVIMNSEGKLPSIDPQKDASGKSLEYFRTQQDNLLQSFVQKWGTVLDQPTQLKPNPARNSKTSYSEIVK
ncbi:peptidase S13, D-Ala-D-Ala carboxypeptidase C [Calothrix sp. NIES-4071]|nr:peptidase S13, D-Ala-D-Ala carboxypeptidase C [Calothrix sp. NIES-4071]BAZ54744.1 peptidase S13, D-Ala-D-Ala carboxypeptidase C [Calothrix sp. NIES-4105]